MQKKYRPQIDIVSKCITISCLFILILIIKFLIIDPDLVKIIGLFILFFSLLLITNFFPMVFIIDNDDLIIKRIFFQKKIKIKSISEISRINNIIPFTYGTKGFFGYLGKTMDGSISYSTSLKNNILIKINSKSKLIISPSKIDEFLKELKSKNQD